MLTFESDQSLGAEKVTEKLVVRHHQDMRFWCWKRRGDEERGRRCG
jgi:hypothetical protein